MTEFSDLQIRCSGSFLSEGGFDSLALPPVHTQANDNFRMTEFDSNQFLDNLLAAIDRTSNGAGFRCPVCADSEWTVVDGTMAGSIEGPAAGTVRTVPVVCDNCGFVAHFAVGQE